MEKNIFITSLSTLRNLKTAYYYTDLKGPRRYFTGSFTNEPGAKMFLAQRKADKLVIIGSDQTFDAAKPNAPVRLGEISVDKDPSTKREKALDYFKRQMAAFARGIDPAPAVFLQTNEVRRKELMALTETYLRENGVADPQTWFDCLSNDKKLADGLFAFIRENIRSGYARPEDYTGYGMDVPLSALPELKRLEEGDISASEMIEELRKLQDEAFQTLLQKEQFLLLGVSSVDNRILRLERERLEKHNEALGTVIEKLRAYNISLQKEISDIKSRREDEEIAYIRHCLYAGVDEDRKLHCLDGQLVAAVEFVPLMRGELYNIRGIIDAILGAAPDDGEIGLYIDVQGGDRTDAFVRSQILSMVSGELGSRIHIRQILSSGFEPGNFASPMRDETERYRISDLVSGMNAFASYGKTGVLRNYFTGRGISPAQKTLLEAMEEIDHAITLCDIDQLERGIQTLKSSLHTDEKTDSGTSELISVLSDGIRRDYGKLLDDSISAAERTMELIKWAFRKDLLQQTLTIIEAKIPDLLVDNGLLYFPSDEAERMDIIKDSDKDALKWQSLNTYFIKGYFNYLSKSDPQYKKARIEQIIQSELKIRKKPDASHVSVHSELGKRHWNELTAVWSRYKALVKMRNKVCHLNERIPPYDTLREEIEKFIPQLEKLFVLLIKSDQN